MNKNKLLNRENELKENGNITCKNKISGGLPMLEREMMNLLDSCYDKALEGVLPGERTVMELAEDYLGQSCSREKAIDNLIGYQTVLCGTNGFIAGLGGLLVLPVAIPANITSVIYVQLRMIAAIAYINGYDIYSDQVRTIAYACLTGSSATNILKNVGIKIGEKNSSSSISKNKSASGIQISYKIWAKRFSEYWENDAICRRINWWSI